MNHAQIEPEHLLLALVEQADGIVPALAAKDGRRAEAGGRSAARRAVEAAGGVRRIAADALSPPAQGDRRAEAEAERLKDEFVSTEHLLLGIVSEGGRGASSRAAPAVRHHEGSRSSRS